MTAESKEDVERIIKENYSETLNGMQIEAINLIQAATEEQIKNKNEKTLH